MIIVIVASVTEIIIQRMKSRQQEEAELENNNISSNPNHNGISHVFGSTDTVLKQDTNEPKKRKRSKYIFNR